MLRFAGVSKEAQAGAFYIDPSDLVNLNQATPEAVKEALVKKLRKVDGYGCQNIGAPGHIVVPKDPKILKAFKSCAFSKETTTDSLSKTKILPKRVAKLLAHLKAASAISAVVDDAEKLVNAFSKMLWKHEFRYIDKDRLKELCDFIHKWRKTHDASYLRATGAPLTNHCGYDGVEEKLSAKCQLDLPVCLQQQ